MIPRGKLDEFEALSLKPGRPAARGLPSDEHARAWAPTPTRASATPTGAVRGTEGLYVADASLLPTSVGVNPMMTIIACATHVAGDVAESLAG